MIVWWRARISVWRCRMSKRRKVEGMQAEKIGTNKRRPNRAVAGTVTDVEESIRPRIHDLMERRRRGNE